MWMHKNVLFKMVTLHRILAFLPFLVYLTVTFREKPFLLQLIQNLIINRDPAWISHTLRYFWQDLCLLLLLNSFISCHYLHKMIQSSNFLTQEFDDPLSVCPGKGAGGHFEAIHISASSGCCSFIKKQPPPQKNNQG